MNLSENIALLCVFQSYLGGLANTHSSLKTASLDLDLSTTGMSGFMTGRDENLHILPDMPDDDEEEDDEVSLDGKSNGGSQIYNHFERN